MVSVLEEKECLMEDKKIEGIEGAHSVTLFLCHKMVAMHCFIWSLAWSASETETEKIAIQYPAA